MSVPHKTTNRAEHIFLYFFVWKVTVQKKHKKMRQDATISYNFNVSTPVKLKHTTAEIMTIIINVRFSGSVGFQLVAYNNENKTEINIFIFIRRNRQQIKTTKTTKKEKIRRYQHRKSTNNPINDRLQVTSKH
jgi:hypothetical protein